jgi:hypothetical protein
MGVATVVANLRFGDMLLDSDGEHLMFINWDPDGLYWWALSWWPSDPPIEAGITTRLREMIQPRRYWPIEEVR